MSDALLRDTHIALWLDSGDPRLRAATRNLIEECWRGGGAILLSAVTVWEIALLVDPGGLNSTCRSPHGWTASSDGRGSRSLPLGHHAAAVSYDLHRSKTVIPPIDC